MHYRRYDLNLLVVLSAIFEEGSITRASEKLNLTQPAVSHALARLRDVFRDPLFVRRGAAMVPTPMARDIAERVRGALASLSALTEPAEFDPVSQPRVFRLALRDVFESVVLPPLMAELEACGSPIEIHSVRSHRDDIEGELRRGAIDLAVDVPFLTEPEIVSRRVVQDPLMVVARDGHPALAGGLDLDTYMAQGHILVSIRRAGPGLADAELNRLGLRRRIRLRCQHYFAACEVVRCTDLLLTMPGHYARVMAAVVPNRLAPFPVALPDLDAVMYWHASMTEDPASRWLRGRVGEILASMAPF